MISKGGCLKKPSMRRDCHRWANSCPNWDAHQCICGQMGLSFVQILFSCPTRHFHETAGCQTVTSQDTTANFMQKWWFEGCYTISVVQSSFLPYSGLIGSEEISRRLQWLVCGVSLLPFLLLKIGLAISVPVLPISDAVHCNRSCSALHPPR